VSLLIKISALGIATYNGLDSPWIKSCRVKFSAPIQTGPGAHPTFYAMGVGSFLRVKQPWWGINYPPPSKAEVK
jgi:hypothetical protein